MCAKKSGISGNRTKVFCIIGDPARHSLSPLMHNAAFNKLGMDSAFLAFDVKADMLKPAIEGMRVFGISGMTLTSPHKIAVMKLIDKIDEDAELIGAVNTVVNKNGVLTGYNTDALGFYNALRNVTSLNGKRVLIIGAGGAGKAATLEIAKNSSAEITVLNRHLKKAEDLRKNIKSKIGVGIKAAKLNHISIIKAVEESDILINTTTLTLEEANASPVPKTSLHRGQIVFDANYVPLRNKLIRDALAKGCKVIYGTELLLQQGFAAFKLFTGRNAPEAAMRRAIASRLGL